MESYEHTEGIALAVIAKAGTLSFTNAANGWYLTNEQAQYYPRKVWFIREPFDRLKSAYSFFKKLAIDNSKYHNKLVEFTNSWEAFIDFVLDTDHKDEHFLPQTSTLMYNGQLSPDTILRFEDVQKWWPKYFVPKLERLNMAPRLEVDPNYRRAEIDTYYAEDLKIWKTTTTYDSERDAGKWPSL